MDSPARLQRLLLNHRPDLPGGLSARERWVEAGGAVLFLGVAAAMAAGLESERGVGLAMLAGLIVFQAAASRIRLFIGAGYAMPTELVLITMLFWLPAGIVPLAVACGLGLSALVDVARRPKQAQRAVLAVNDSWHAIGPALVMWIANEPAAGMDVWALLVPMLAAQFLVDAGVNTAREWAGRGIRPHLQLHVMGWVCAVDLMLAPIGLLAAAATQDAAAAWVLAAPLAVLLGVLSQDRRRRIEEAVAHIEALRGERVRIQSVLRRAGRAFAVNLDRDALLDAVTETAAEALRAEVGFVADGREAGRLRGHAVQRHGPELEEALRHAVAGAREDGRLVTGQAGQWHAIACPLRHRRTGDTIALARQSAPFTAEERDLFDHLTAQASVSLENADLHERLRTQAMVDDLTGLANHRRLQDVLTQSLDEADRTGGSVGLVMLDLDDFKAVNDTYGHQQGDIVLRLAARALRDCCRHFDLPARYGGEELAVAVPGGDLVETHDLAERIREAIGELRFPLSDGTWHLVTLSAGVAAYPACGREKAALIAAADQALYRAKRTGKNRTVVAGTPQPAGALS